MADKEKPCNFRPWPANDNQPKNLREFIERANRDVPGGFRSLNQNKIRAAIEAKKKGLEVKDDLVAKDDDKGGDKDERKEVAVAREEMYKNVE